MRVTAGSTRRTGAPAKAVRGLSALVLTAVWLLLPALPAHAAGEPTLERPSAGERITSHAGYPVVASIDAAAGEEIRGMEARILQGGRQVGGVHTMEFVEVVDAGPGMRRSRWTVDLEPMTWDEGEPLRNTTFRLEVRAQLAFQGVTREPTAWRGGDIVIDVEPPATKVTTKVLEASKRRVEVSWEPVFLPDFLRYMVQRKTGGGEWKDYRVVPTMDATRWADTVPADGTYAYRVQTVRESAGGGERKSSWSPESSVAVRKPAPPAPISGSGTGAAGAPGGTARPNDGPPVLRVRRAPAPRQPIWSGPDTYDEVLDYGDAEAPLASGPEADLAETGAPPEGTLSVDGAGGRSLDMRQVLVPVATGLLLTVSAWHVRRFLRVSADDA